MKYAIALLLVIVAVSAAPSAKEANDSKRVSRQYGLYSPYPQAYASPFQYQYQPFYQPQPYQPSAYFAANDYKEGAVGQASDAYDSSLSYFKKVAGLPDTKQSDAISELKKQGAELTADGRLCIKPLLNLFGLFTTTTTTPRPATCAPNPTCPAAVSSLTYGPGLIAAPAGGINTVLVAANSAYSATSALTGSVTGTGVGTQNVVGIAVAPGFTRIQVSCTSGQFSILGNGITGTPALGGTSQPTANTLYTTASSTSSFVTIVSTANAPVADRCTWTQLS